MSVESPSELAPKVLDHLEAEYPDAECALVHADAFQMLIATILAAQCTDERVNQVTATLFDQFPDAAAFANAELEDIEAAVRPTGFYRNKAKSIRGCCQALLDEFDGEVPAGIDQLVSLPGIGRKTANLVLGVARGLATGVVVDTHVGRVSQRLGLTGNKDAAKIERDLMELVPESRWIDFSNQMILHGRQVCKARKPRCEECSMQVFCPREGVDST